MYSNTCLNRSCSKAETLLKRTDTFSFHAFLKRKTVRRKLLQTGNIFSPQLNKTPCLTRTQKFQEFPRNRELNWTFLSTFSKRNVFFTLQSNIFFISIWSFEEVQLFWLELFIPSCSLQPTNNCFRATESDIDLQTIFHPFMNYCFQYCDLH